MRLAILLVAICSVCEGDPSTGTWKMNAARSTSNGGTQPKSLSVRIEGRPKGELFTMERIEPDGRMTTSSTVLYLDSLARNFQDYECSGTQSSRRVDAGTVEIVRKCGSGAWTRFVWQPAAKQNELVLEITEQRPDGKRLEQRFVLERAKEMR